MIEPYRRARSKKTKGTKMNTQTTESKMAAAMNDLAKAGAATHAFNLKDFSNGGYIWTADMKGMQNAKQGRWMAQGVAVDTDDTDLVVTSYDRGISGQARLSGDFITADLIKATILAALNSITQNGN